MPDSTSKSANKSGTTIRSCKCKSEYQDNKYGVNRRVHNMGNKADSCTVCGDKKVR